MLGIFVHPMLGRSATCTGGGGRGSGSCAMRSSHRASIPCSGSSSSCHVMSCPDLTKARTHTHAHARTHSAHRDPSTRTISSSPTETGSVTTKVSLTQDPKDAPEISGDINQVPGTQKKGRKDHPLINMLDTAVQHLQEAGRQTRMQVGSVSVQRR